MQTQGTLSNPSARLCARPTSTEFILPLQFVHNNTLSKRTVIGLLEYTWWLSLQGNWMRGSSTWALHCPTCLPKEDTRLRVVRIATKIGCLYKDKRDLSIFRHDKSRVRVESNRIRVQCLHKLVVLLLACVHSPRFCLQSFYNVISLLRIRQYQRYYHPSS